MSLCVSVLAVNILISVRYCFSVIRNLKSITTNDNEHLEWMRSFLCAAHFAAVMCTTSITMYAIHEMHFVALHYADRLSTLSCTLFHLSFHLFCAQPCLNRESAVFSDCKRKLIKNNADETKTER